MYTSPVHSRASCGLFQYIPFWLLTYVLLGLKSAIEYCWVSIFINLWTSKYPVCGSHFYVSRPHKYPGWPLVSVSRMNSTLRSSIPNPNLSHISPVYLPSLAFYLGLQSLSPYSSSSCLTMINMEMQEAQLSILWDNMSIIILQYHSMEPGQNILVSFLTEEK